MSFIVLVHKEPNKDAMTVAAFDRESMAAHGIPLDGAKTTNCIAYQMCLHCAGTQNIWDAMSKGFYLVELANVDERIEEEYFNEALCRGIQEKF